MPRDMMPHFELYQPDTRGQARIDLAKDDRRRRWLLAGGQDSFDWFKDRAKRPEARHRHHGHHGAHGHARNRRWPRDRRADHAHRDRSRMRRCVREKYGLLAAAAGRVASPQIRNAGTLGGNLCQDARCWYYRDGRELLSRGWQHLLRRHAAGPEPRALPVWRAPLHRGDAIGHGAPRAWRSTRTDGHRGPARASASCRPRNSSSARRWTSRA